MAGLIRKLTQLPPGKTCCACLLTHHEEITWFLETGIFTEVEGQNYLCNRCFNSMVLITQDYLTVDNFNAEIAAFKRTVDKDLNRLASLEVAVSVLKREFKLDLEDLFNYDKLRKDYASLREASREINEELLSCREEIEQARVTREIFVSQLDELAVQINAKTVELDDVIYTSLQRVLEQRGRTDLIDIIFNNRIPQGIEYAPTGSESEPVEVDGETESVFSGF